MITLWLKKSTHALHSEISDQFVLGTYISFGFVPTPESHLVTMAPLLVVLLTSPAQFSQKNYPRLKNDLIF